MLNSLSVQSAENICTSEDLKNLNFIITVNHDNLLLDWNNGFMMDDEEINSIHRLKNLFMA